MKFGYNPTLPVLEPFNLKVDYNTTRDLVLRCEELGFHSVWVNDHLNLGGGIEEGSTSSSQSGYKIGAATFEGWTLLTALAVETEKVRLGTLVICNPFRNPAVLAKMASTFDMISGGRLDFGIGAGWHKPEFEQYGVPYGTFQEREQRLREGLEITKSLWGEELSTYEGKYYNVKNAELEPKPLQKPHPPIFIGASGEKMLKLTAEFADNWNAFFMTLDEVVAKREFIDRTCTSIGRDQSEIKNSMHTHIFISNDQEDVDKVIGIFRGEVDTEEYRSRNLIGSPEEIVERVEQYAEVGIEQMQLLFLDCPSRTGLELFASEVMPQV